MNMNITIDYYTMKIHYANQLMIHDSIHSKSCCFHRVTVTTWMRQNGDGNRAPATVRQASIGLRSKWLVPTSGEDGRCVSAAWGAVWRSHLLGRVKAGSSAWWTCSAGGSCVFSMAMQKSFFNSHHLWYSILGS